MSAIATGDGAYVAERVGQLTMPPTITTIRNMSDVVPISAARIPCRASGTLAAIEPVVMPTRLYQRINCNTADSRSSGITLLPKPIQRPDREDAYTAAASRAPVRGRIARRALGRAAHSARQSLPEGGGQTRRAWPAGELTRCRHRVRAPARRPRVHRLRFPCRGEGCPG